MFKYDLRNLRGDIFGGITAGIIALPLALAFGVQSGLGAIAGLYGAIALGFFAALFGGTATQISGPTGPMTVVSATVISSAIATAGSLDNAYSIILTTFFVSGILQILLGVTRVGHYIRYMPYPVVSGFMSGIGIIIILLQLFPFMGHPSPPSVAQVVTNIATPLQAINHYALGYGLLTLILIYTIPYITKAIPSSLLALVLVTILAALLDHPVPKITDIPIGFPELMWDNVTHISLATLTTILAPAITLAALGTIDSLLTSVVADNLTKTRHNSNKELVGQGIGNMVAALIGGIPGAGATMRTVVNIRAGGLTPLSGVLHSLLLLAVLLGLGKYAEQIPLSVLAGILITVGTSIIDYRGIKHLLHVPMADALVLVTVVLLTVFVNLLQAVLVGVILACVLFMKKISDIAEERSQSLPMQRYKKDNFIDLSGPTEQLSEHIYIKHIHGPLFFGFASEFQRLVFDVPDVKIVVLVLSDVPYMDQSGLYAIEEAVLYLESRNIDVALVETQTQPLDMLRRINVIPDLIKESEIFNSLEECMRWAQQHLSEDS